MTYVNDRAVDKLGPILLPVVESVSDHARTHVALSPERATAPAAPVFLLHGAEDNVIPSVETVLLTNYLRGKTEVHAVLSGLITHAEVDKSAAAIEVWRLVGFWKDLMAQVGSRHASHLDSRQCLALDNDRVRHDGRRMPEGCDALRKGEASPRPLR